MDDNFEIRWQENSKKASILGLDYHCGLVEFGMRADSVEFWFLIRFWFSSYTRTTQELYRVWLPSREFSRSQSPSESNQKFFWTDPPDADTVSYEHPGFRTLKTVEPGSRRACWTSKTSGSLSDAYLILHFIPAFLAEPGDQPLNCLISRLPAPCPKRLQSNGICIIRLHSNPGLCRIFSEDSQQTFCQIFRFTHSSKYNTEQDDCNWSRLD